MDHEENQEERATLAPSVRRHSVMSEGQIQGMHVFTKLSEEFLSSSNF